MMYTMNEVAAIKANECVNRTVEKQLETGKPVFHEVALYATENDDYIELWYSEKEDTYYGRYVYGYPKWCYISDPLGYCERDYDVHNNHVFIIEGADLAVSNLEGAYFPSLKETYLEEWRKIKNDYPHFEDNQELSYLSEWLGNGSLMTVDKWLVSFMDPAKYEKEIRSMYGYEENWRFHVKTIEREVIKTFNYLGEEYYIVKETREHEICKKRFLEYYVDDKIELGKYDSHVAFLADYCEGKPGAVYPENDAIKIVVDALKRIYNNERISEIRDGYGYYYERLITYRNAAERLLNGSYNRQYVAALIRNEEKEHSFFIHKSPEIEEKYPGYTKDHIYNYDHLGRRW